MMTKVFVINNQDLPSVENINHSGARKSQQDVHAKNQVQDLNAQKEDTSLETERKHHYGIACKRQENFKLIIQHGQFEFSWTKCIAYPVAIPIIGVLPTLLMTLIPAHDLILYPEYWYEIIFHGLLQNTCLYSYMSLLAASLFNLKYIIQQKNVSYILFVGNLICLGLLVSSYYSWTEIFDKQFPIPNLGFILTTIMVFSSHVVIWRKFPSEWRKDKKFKKRMIFYLLYFVYTAILGILYQILAERIRLTNISYQPIVALALPVTREISVWIGMKFIKKICSADEKGAELFLQYTLSARHAIVVGSFMSSVPNSLVSYVLMGADFLINVLLCLWIVWSKVKHPDKIHSQIDLLQELAIAELTEFHAPLSLIVTISLAYFGPNATILGNISNDYWQYEAIEDINGYMANLGLFFMIEFSCAIVTTIILWFTCRINLCKAFVELQEEFGKSYCVVLGYMLMTVLEILLYLKVIAIIK